MSQQAQSKSVVKHATIEYVLWALPAGQTDRLHEQVLYTQAKTPADNDRVAELAARDGWHGFRVQVLDLAARPDFAASVRS